MLTLKQANELNPNKLTLEQLEIIHKKQGYVAPVVNGVIPKFVPETRQAALVEFRGAIERTHRATTTYNHNHHLANAHHI